MDQVIETVTVEGDGLTVSVIVWRRFKRPMPGLVEANLRDAARHAGISQIEIDPALRNLTRGYFETRDESLVAMGERLAREIRGNFRVTGGRIVFSKRNADYATAIAATWGQNLQSWDIAPKLGRPQFGAVRGRWYDVAAGAWQVIERATGIDVPSIYADRFARAGEVETTKQGESDASTTARDADEGTVVIEGNTAAVPDVLCTVSGTRPGVDGSYHIEAVTHTLTRTGGFVTRLELKQPQQGAGADERTATARSSSRTRTSSTNMSFCTVRNRSLRHACASPTAG
ncbi:hypothetical protein HGG71_13965 [Rhodobacteraceae bacterium R_SAG2]|nr:hypothetical protein [Rhodobacteraceae bacterium R_SAG2]